jgi:tRNA C32,U32 (ribose-2'-O)-methylase TrmJ
MPESRLAHIAIVLYEPQDPVNIAATVRAMKNMGVSTLRLVRPVKYDPVRLEGIAHDTWDVIDAIEHYDDFDAAVADCVRLVGFTARRQVAAARSQGRRRGCTGAHSVRPGSDRLRARG